MKLSCMLICMMVTSFVAAPINAIPSLTTKQDEDTLTTSETPTINLTQAPATKYGKDLTKATQNDDKLEDDNISPMSQLPHLDITKTEGLKITTLTFNSTAEFITLPSFQPKLNITNHTGVESTSLNGSYTLFRNIEFPPEAPVGLENNTLDRFADVPRSQIKFSSLGLPFGKKFGSSFLPSGNVPQQNLQPVCLKDQHVKNMGQCLVLKWNLPRITADDLNNIRNYIHTRDTRGLFAYINRCIKPINNADLYLDVFDCYLFAIPV